MAIIDRLNWSLTDLACFHLCWFWGGIINGLATIKSLPPLSWFLYEVGNPDDTTALSWVLQRILLFKSDDDEVAFLSSSVIPLFLHQSGDLTTDTSTFLLASPTYRNNRQWSPKGSISTWSRSYKTSRYQEFMDVLKWNSVQ